MIVAITIKTQFQKVCTYRALSKGLHLAMSIRATTHITRRLKAHVHRCRTVSKCAQLHIPCSIQEHASKNFAHWYTSYSA